MSRENVQSVPTFKTGLDLGACAYGVYSATQSIDNYLDSPSPAKETEAYANAFSGVLGCAVTGIGAAVGD